MNWNLSLTGWNLSDRLTHHPFVESERLAYLAFLAHPILAFEERNFLTVGNACLGKNVTPFIIHQVQTLVEAAISDNSTIQAPQCSKIQGAMDAMQRSLRLPSSPERPPVNKSTEMGHCCIRCAFFCCSLDHSRNLEICLYGQDKLQYHRRHLVHAFCGENWVAILILLV